MPTVSMLGHHPMLSSDSTPPATDTAIPVSEFSRRMRAMIEANAPLQWITGEVSNLTCAASGHVYFSLKDARAQVRCVLFRSRAQLLDWRLDNGQAIEIRAHASLYEPRGDFQLTVENARRAGTGSLFERFLQLKARLESEGLFDPTRKQGLPRFPHTIHVVTSIQAAALRDVIAVTRRRAPHVHLILHPVPVQGPDAAQRIAAALRTADARPDAALLLLCRGGGNLEDLWSFNEETVARAIAACRTPVIVGVGHETDFTIADFVADVRAATPTAAAEIATRHWVAAPQQLGEIQRRLRQRAAALIDLRRQQVDHLQHRLQHPRERLRTTRARLRELGTRLIRQSLRQQAIHRELLERLQVRLIRGRPEIATWRTRLAVVQRHLNEGGRVVLQSRRQALEVVAAALRQLNPGAVMNRGYALVRRADGHLVIAPGEMKPGEKIVVHWTQGEADATIDAVRHRKYDAA